MSSRARATTAFTKRKFTSSSTARTKTEESGSGGFVSNAGVLFMCGVRERALHKKQEETMSKLAYYFFRQMTPPTSHVTLVYCSSQKRPFSALKRHENACSCALMHASGSVRSSRTKFGFAPHARHARQKFKFITDII